MFNYTAACALYYRAWNRSSIVSGLISCLAHKNQQVALPVYMHECTSKPERAHRIFNVITRTIFYGCQQSQQMSHFFFVTYVRTHFLLDLVLCYLSLSLCVYILQYHCQLSLGRLWLLWVISPCVSVRSVRLSVFLFFFAACSFVWEGWFVKLPERIISLWCVRAFLSDIPAPTTLSHSVWFVCLRVLRCYHSRTVGEQFVCVCT